MSLQLFEQPLVRGVVAEPLLATDQRLVLGHAGAIALALRRQDEGDGVSLRVCRVAFQQVIGSHRDGDGKLIDWLDELTAECPKKIAHNMNDPCGARCRDLARVL